MPSGASASTAEPAEPPLLLLQQHLAGLGLGKEEGDGGEPELLEEEEEEDEEEEEEEDDAAAAALMLLPSATSQLLFDAVGSRAMMAAVLPQPYGGAAGLGGEQAALLRRKSFNTTECVAVPSSEHVAEIVGRQGMLNELPMDGWIRLH